MKILTYCFCVTALLINGCIRGYSDFVSQCDNMVGCSVELSPYDPAKITSFDEKQDAYHYVFEDTGCKFIYYVNKYTGIVESWEFVSSPDNCYLIYQGY